MANITFKAKVQTMYNADDSVAYEYVSIPVFRKSHCDMVAFRNHPKYSGIANSDIFVNALARVRRDLSSNGLLNLSKLPSNITIDRSGFLASIVVSI